MKKIILLASMLTLLFSFSFTAHAEVSPEGTPIIPEQPSEPEDPPVVDVPEVLGAVRPIEDSGVLGVVRSPKTGDDSSVLFVWGSAVVVLAAGAAVAGKKSRA